MNVALWLITLLVVIILILIILIHLKDCPIENFAVEYKSDALLKYMERSGNTTAFFHDPYTYSYLAYGARPQNTYFLPFMCMKFPDKSLQDWTQGDNNPLELIRSCINTDTCSFSQDFLLPCKVSQVYSLDPVNPTQSAIENVKKDISENMKDYVNTTGINILAPVYVVLIQYPNKWDTNGKDINGYHYSQFDVENLDPKPCVRRNIFTDEYTVCNKTDTSMIVVYPMYSRTSGKFYDYGVVGDEYDLNLSADIQNNLKKDLPTKPNFKGIVDMIKFFGRYASKNQLCFIECNNDASLLCGCATRKDGTDNPVTDPDNTYKSFCKGPYDPSNESSKTNFSHYAFLYRVNEREKIINKDSFSNYLTDINMDAETESKINAALTK